MSDGGRELAHGGHAIGVRELHLHLAISPLAFASFCLRALALGQIKHEGNTLVAPLSERGRADQHGHAVAVLARHSGGIKPVKRMLPAARSSRSYPTILRNASLASMISPVRLEMKIPMMLASTRRRIFFSRSATSRYKWAFSSAMAACEASSFSTAIRAGVNTCDARLFSR